MGKLPPGDHPGVREGVPAAGPRRRRGQGRSASVAQGPGFLGPTRHPHQLRHTAGTRIRREFGLEAAAATLGHSSAKLTDEVYAERYMQRVAEVMKRMG